MDISENSALFVYPEARRSGNAPGRPRRQMGRRRASAGSYRHGGLKLKYSGIGGQAVLEGIMMKNKDTYATAVRKPDGEIVIQKDTYVSMTEKVKFFSLPFVRGIFSFADSMILGMKTLTWSASFFEDDEEDEAPGRFESFLIDKFGEKMESVVMTAVMIFSVFMYHGSEHKCINCLENGLVLNVENVRKSSKEHKRCGTSFLLIVMVISILFFMVVRVDTIWLRIVSRIVLIPVIAGVSYEVLRLAGTSNSKIMDIISRPGMWMQGLTTKEPDDSMIQVAIAAVEEVFDWKKYLEENFPETYPAGYFEEQEKLA